MTHTNMQLLKNVAHGLEGGRLVVVAHVANTFDSVLVLFCFGFFFVELQPLCAHNSRQSCHFPFSTTNNLSPTV